MGRPVIQFHVTDTAHVVGVHAIVDRGHGRFSAFGTFSGARGTAVSECLPGFWRLKERKA